MSSHQQTGNMESEPALRVNNTALVPDAQIDAGTTGCGELTMLIFHAMKQLVPGQTLEVLAYDLAAGVDIPAWCRQTHNSLLITDLTTKPQRFLLQKQN